jgi:hypothetical protein
MTRFLLVLITGLSLQFSSFSQRIEFSAFANHSNFVNGGIHFGSGLNPHEKLTYKNGYGYAFAVGINDVKIGIPFRFTLQYNHYTGGIAYSNYGLGNSDDYNFTTNKDILGFGIYPVNISILKRIKLSIGAEMNVLVHDKQNGYQNTFDVTRQQMQSVNLNGKNVNNPLYVGANMTLRYEFKLCDEWKIAPQAMVYIPLLSNEFKDAYYPTATFRTYLGLTFIKEL